MANAQVNIEYGSLHPMDESEGESKDWAHAAARGVAAMMQDNPELNAVLEAMDGAARSEFIAAMSDIMREAQMMDSGDAPTDEQPAQDMTAE